MHGADFQDSLRDFFPTAILPPEYGGEGPSMEEACQDWTGRLLRSEEILQRIAGHPTGDVAVAPEERPLPGADTEQQG